MFHGIFRDYSPSVPPKPIDEVVINLISWTSGRMTFRLQPKLA
jgi:hypothetical protein